MFWKYLLFVYCFTLTIILIVLLTTQRQSVKSLPFGITEEKKKPKRIRAPPQRPFLLPKIKLTVEPSLISILELLIDTKSKFPYHLIEINCPKTWIPIVSDTMALLSISGNLLQVDDLSPNISRLSKQNISSKLQTLVKFLVLKNNKIVAFTNSMENLEQNNEPTSIKFQSLPILYLENNIVIHSILYTPKISCDGRFTFFPGRSIVSFARWDRSEEMLQELKEGPLTLYYSLLPVDSYHITIFDLYQLYPTGNNYLNDKPLEANFPSHCTVQDVSFCNNVLLLMVRFQDLKKIENIRLLYSKQSGVDISPKILHITLGYKYNSRQLSGVLQQNTLDKLHRHLKNAKIQLSPPQLCRFDSIDKFSIVNRN